MVELLGHDRFEVDLVHGQRITVREILPESAMFDRYGQHVEMSAGLPEPVTIRSKKFKWKPRILQMVCGDLLQTEHIQFADVVMIETDFPEVSMQLYAQLWVCDNFLFSVFLAVYIYALVPASRADEVRCPSPDLHRPPEDMARESRVVFRRGARPGQGHRFHLSRPSGTAIVAAVGTGLDTFPTNGFQSIAFRSVPDDLVSEAWASFFCVAKGAYKTKGENALRFSCDNFMFCVENAV
jgi:hypothetical protein